MSELINSSANFYLNAETYNSSNVPIDAVITISDRDDILKFQEHWAVHCTRWAVDTQASLYYVVPNSETWVTLTTVKYHQIADHAEDMTKHYVDQRTLRMTTGASTLADFLQQLNDAVPVAERPIVSAAGGVEIKSGIWTVTPSGSFKFEAKKNKDSAKLQIAVYHPDDDEYMVNIRMSESMREILGFKNAHTRVLGNSGKLRLYKAVIANFVDELAAYRKNIDNWRWTGLPTHWHKCNWLSEMWYIINAVLLRGVPLDRNGQQVSVAVTRHPTHIGDFHSEGRIQGLAFWEEEDYLISNYQTPSGQGAVGANAGSTHEYTMFSKLHSINNETDQMLQRDSENAAIHTQADHRWSQLLVQDGSGYQNQDEWVTTVDHSGRRGFLHNAKQTWGSWTRAYILQVQDQRSVFINRANLSHIQGQHGANTGDGGYSQGIPPVIGDTIYIPGSTNLDGSGYTAGVVNDNNRMQRGIITSVTETRCDRATAGVLGQDADGEYYTGDDAWLVIFDTELEINADRLLYLNCQPVNGGGDF